MAIKNVSVKIFFVILIFFNCFYFVFFIVQT